MAKQVTFDKPDGFITVTDGSRTWVISKDEAKNASVTTDETPTLAEKMGVLFTVLITLLPIERRRKIRYEVKIVTESGEEVALFSGRNIDLASDMLKRIEDFAREQ